MRITATLSRQAAGAVLLAALLSTSLIAVPVGAAVSASAQQQGNYDVQVEFPDSFTVGDNQTMSVVVDNTGNDEAVFSPIVEIPLSPAVEASPGATETAFVVFENGTEQSRTAEVQNSSYRDGKALFVFGEEVPAGGVRTYRFNLTINESGTRTVESEVRPLYNEDVRVRDSAEKDAAGFGELQAEVVRTDGSVVTDADILIDNATAASGRFADDLVEGDYRVNASDGNSDTIPFTGLTRSVAVGETTSVEFVQRSDLSSPGVLARTQSAEVVGPSVGNVTTEATATQPAEANVSFLLDTTGGVSVVGLATPGNVGPVDTRNLTTTADTGNISTTDRNVRVQVEATGDSEIAVRFVGFRLGDRTRDKQVNRSDAEAIAQQVVTDGSTTKVSDINGDSEVTAVDAMLVAQFADGNRDEEYKRGGSE